MLSSNPVVISMHNAGNKDGRALFPTDISRQCKRGKAVSPHVSPPAVPSGVQEGGSDDKDAETHKQPVRAQDLCKMYVIWLSFRRVSL